MKTPAQVVAALDSKLAKNWSQWVLDSENCAWPLTLSISPPTRREFEQHYTDTYRPILDAWATWTGTASNDCSVTTDRRILGRLRLDVPTHVQVPTLDAAAHLVGTQWPTTISRARRRLTRLAADLQTHPNATMLRQCVALSDVDFDLLCSTVDWFRDHNVQGLTTRQIPVPGLHAKWLDKHRALVLAMLGRDTLTLVDRPQRLDLTYLDPQWRAAGGRLRDSLASDDPHATIGYPPQIILITENRDSALFFPTLEHAIAIEGGGNTIIKRISQYPWIQQCPLIMYWGDIDADGLEILARLRATCCAPVRSVLMDTDAYTTYRQYGGRTDRHGKPLRTTRDPATVATAATHLIAGERTLYDHLRDDTHTGPLRIEQERISLDDAARAVAHISHRDAPL